MLSSAGVAPFPPGFHKLLSVTVTIFCFFSSWMYPLGGDDNSCCLCHLVRVTPAFAVGRVVKFSRE